jgi:hypothetical protein
VDIARKAAGHAASADRHVKYWWNKFVKNAKSNSEVVVALSTLVMAAFTVTLFAATWALWKSGERHSERSLRAYVFPVEIKVQNFKTSTPIVAFVEIKNSGQTPAYNFTCYAKMTAGQFPQKDFSVSAHDRRREAGLRDLPGGLAYTVLRPYLMPWHTSRG